MSDLNAILSGFNASFAAVNEKREALDRAKNPPHPWRQRNPLNPPTDPKAHIPDAHLMGLRIKR